jgi:hypothetical protein
MGTMKNQQFVTFKERKLLMITSERTFKRRGWVMGWRNADGEKEQQKKPHGRFNGEVERKT